MLTDLLSPALLPFTVSIGLMLLIALTEAVGMLVGLSTFAAADQLLPGLEVDADADVSAGVTAGGGMLSGLLAWLCVGRVPALVLLVAFLTAFGCSGVALQTTLHGLTGAYLPAVLASAVALFIALPPTRWLALGLAKVMPKEETEAVSLESFVGKVAVITGGIARAGQPAQAKLRDAHGQSHYVLVEPDDAEAEFLTGSEVLLTIQTSSGRFHAISVDNTLLSRS